MTRRTHDGPVAAGGPTYSQVVRPVIARPVVVGLAVAGVVVAALVGTVALLVGGGVQLPRPGLPDAGGATRWGLPLARVLGDLAAAATVGLLVGGVVLVPNRGRVLQGQARRLVLLGGRAAAVWCALTVSTAVLTVSDVTGVPLRDLSTLVDPDVVLALPQIRAALLTATMTAVVALAARAAGTHLAAAVVLVLTVLALTPGLTSGHSGHGSSPVLASSVLVVHVVAVSVWVGGLGVVLLLARAPGPVLTAAVTRYSPVALVCYLLVGLSGLASGWLWLGGVQDLATGYGAIVLAKTVAFGVLGLLGAGHRRRTLPLLRQGRAGALTRLAAVELTVMLLAITLAVVLSRTPVP